VWWLPGGVLLASAGILTLDAILLQKDQNFGYVLRLIELWAACVSAMLGLVLIHGVAAFRRYLPRRATLVSTRRLVDWPSARVHSAKQRARLAHVYDPQA
jgi:hypothetical protein